MLYLHAVDALYIDWLFYFERQLVLFEWRVVEVEEEVIEEGSSHSSNEGTDQRNPEPVVVDSETRFIVIRLSCFESGQCL